MSVMVLGTASHVGKSTVVAALCRALIRRGISVAPFKSQNMSLNSYVTEDGGEMGIAQAAQAMAACLPPHVDMNPILLKPKGEKTSQIVLLGRPYRDLPISEYYKETDHLLSVALESAGRLRAQFGHLVVEGAGGAAEVNLYPRDIANIRLAKALQFPILLVADIERGGVFAQVVGTLVLLPPEIRALVKGVIINKFRGDPELYSEGIQILEKETGIPVLGVLPFTDLALPSEDSLSIPDKRSGDHPIRIAIVRFPHIANFTDFELLERFAEVRYIPMGAPLLGYDCIILPGTKNTIEDLQVLQDSGTAEAVSRARENSIPILGICGGYQMLGTEIVDSGIESRPGQYKGLGLLDVVTRFGEYRKSTRQTSHRARPVAPILSGMGTVRGYEIHMGETERTGSLEAFEGEGSVSADGLVIGTYMHGLFQNPSAVHALLSYLYQTKGIPYYPSQTEGPDPLEACAQWFEQYVDMSAILPFFNS
jgi:adenosylcobyric acid synthase